MFLEVIDHSFEFTSVSNLALSGCATCKGPVICVVNSDYITEIKDFSEDFSDTNLSVNIPDEFKYEISTTKRSLIIDKDTYLRVKSILLHGQSLQRILNE